MIRWLLGLCCVLVGAPLLAEEFKDPMQPPPYAVYKMRLEKQRDVPPTAQNKSAAQTAPTWELNSILYSSQRRHAIINNKLVRQGDTVDGAKLVRLRPDSARLIAKSKVIDLKLSTRAASIKKIAKENEL